MAHIYVLRFDWGSAKDPVPYYGQAPGQCLDFNNRRAKPRGLLTPVEEAVIGDCEHGVPYEVVVCEAPDV
jgi:hypothetical protein